MFTRHSRHDEPTVIDMVPGRERIQADAESKYAPTTPAAHHPSATRQLALSDLVDSPHQPRKRPLSKKDVADLMASIAAVGQTTPIIVTPADKNAPGKYVVHAGHRRCAALRFLGHSMVTAIVRSDLDERDARKLAVADNLGREDLSAIEQAVAVRDYAAAFELGFDDAAAELGVQPRTAFRLKAILGASAELLDVLRAHAIAAKPAELLVKLEGQLGKRALRLAEKYVGGAVSSVDLENKLRADSPRQRPVRASVPIELHIDDAVVTLKARIVRAALTDSERDRVKGTLAEFVAALGIGRIDPQVAALLNGSFGRKEIAIPTAAEFADDFVEVYARTNNKPSEARGKENMLRMHLLPAFGRLRLDEIDALTIERYKRRKLSEHLSPKTINNHLAVLSRMLTLAVEWERLPHAPPMKWLRVPEQKFDFLDFEEAARLEAAAEGMWKVMVIVALNTGLRHGELLALRWEDVDLVAGRLFVRRSDWKGVIQTPKNGRERELPLNAKVTKALRAHKHLRGPLIFCRDDGSALTYRQMHHGAAAIWRRAGLRAIQWHVLRHSFASHLVMRGVPMKAVQELMGHATMEMTMRYAHLSPDVRREAVDALLRPADGPATGSEMQVQDG